MKTNNLILIILIIWTQISFAGELIYFNSANPFSFKDIIKNLDDQEKQIAYGVLNIPENSTLPVPLIIGVAGSMGWGPHNFEYMELYRKMGIATFELNSFKCRNISSTVGDQIQVTTAMMILDAYRALEVLSNDPRIDANRIGLTGWSLGGGVTLFSGWEPLKSIISPELDFIARLAFYPPCFAHPENIDFTKNPTHILIGELDNWTPAIACEELVESLNNNGYTNFGLTVYEDSHHSFDRDSELGLIEDGYNFTDCRFNITDDGAVRMNFLNIPMTTPLLQKIGLSFCAQRGPTFGGNPESREKAFQFAEFYFSKYLILE